MQSWILCLLCVSSISYSLADSITPILLHKRPLDRRFSKEEEDWRHSAIEKLWKERRSMGHTPLEKFSPAGYPNVDIFLKNETATATRTLKHRFSWALIMWAIVEGMVGRNSTVYDSTSGNTGASEAYMCTLVGLPYVAVVAKELEQAKVDQIESNGGKVMKVDVSLRNFHAEKEAEKTGGYFINQFGNADRAEEYHESGNYEHESTNIYHEILAQLEADDKQKKKIPDYFVHSSGTGGTISSVGRYVARYALPTRVVLADSQFSLFHDYVIHNKFTNESGSKLWVKPGVAGIGYGYNVKPVIYGETTSLVRSVVHESMKIPDIATTAAMQVLRRRGINGGASTALNYLVSLAKAHEHRSSHDRVTIVTLICDPADFYDSTYYNGTWLAKTFEDRGGMPIIKCWENVIDESMEKGGDFLEKGMSKCVPLKTRGGRA